MANTKIALLWFRQDLRLDDNTALLAACAQGYDIVPVFILDDASAGRWKHGSASRWWLHDSLNRLNDSLHNRLIFWAGNAEKILPEIIAQTGAQAVFWNRCYEPWRTARDQRIKENLKSAGIPVQSFKDALLWEPWEIHKEDGTPYKVFTPFYRRGCLASPLQPDTPRAAPPILPLALHTVKSDDRTAALMPKIRWFEGMQETWETGEAAANQRLQTFIKNGLKGYKNDRNRADKENVSRLSPHLHFGEISVRTVWHAAQAAMMDKTLASDADNFCSELGWREFSYSLLYYNPDLPTQPLQTKFENFPWIKTEKTILKAWQSGRTGIPLVDAGMRQLWETGWMHNRVRMVVASFLIKNLLIHWQEGEDWFWDCLVDADLANNAASWQWVAGCGADAAPYFRIFNPLTQAEKFDPDAAYIRTYVPELRDIATTAIHKAIDLHTLTHGQYPEPIVNLSTSRSRALAALDYMKKGDTILP